MNTLKKILLGFTVLFLLSACSNTTEEFALYQEQVTSVTESKLSQLEGFFVAYDDFVSSPDDDILRERLMVATGNGLDDLTSVYEQIDALSLPKGNHEFNVYAENYHQDLLHYYDLLNVLFTEIQLTLRNNRVDFEQANRYVDELKETEKKLSTSMQRMEKLVEE